MRINSQVYLQPLMPVNNQNNTPQQVSQPKAKNAGTDFANVLQKAKKSVAFSQHAQSRMQQRNINLSSADMAKMNDTVAKMAQKGAKEALIYLNGAAFVVSIKSKTVITAMDGASAKENIFTNIDSAAIV